jgi:polysaccharide chain length determinant protein (PEP-CTERM system associated)
MNSNTPGNTFSLVSLRRTLKRRKLWLLVPIVVLPAAAWFYAQRLPVRFRANALVGSEPLMPGQPAPGNLVDPNTINAQEELRAIRETLYSVPVLDTVAHEFGMRAESSPGSKSTSGDVKSNIQIQLEGPNAFNVGFENGNPELSAKVANRLAGLFVEQTSTLRGQIFEQQDSALDAEVDRLRNQLNAEEEGLKNYKERVSQELPERLDSNLKALENIHQQIQSKTDQIAQAEARRSSIKEEMQVLEKQGVLQEEAPAKTSAQVALDDLRLKLAQLKTRYTAENPEVLRAEKEIRDLEAVAAPAKTTVHAPSPAQLRYFSLQAELKSVESLLASYRQQQAAPVSQAQEYERRINLAPGYETAVADRAKDAAMLRARYEALFAKQQEARLNHRSETPHSGFAFRILEAAQIPAIPYSPHRGRILLFGFMAGLALGVAGVFIAGRLDATFETAEALESFSGLQVLSSVPAIPAATPNNNATRGGSANRFPEEQMRDFEKNRLPVLADPHSVASQQYGILALKVADRMRRSGGRILAITSATGGEGKSLTALNLSLALAECSQGRVLLVDCDFRLPRIHERLGLKTEKGFSDLIAGTETDPAPYISKLGNLDVIASGSTRANPVNLLASARMREILARLRQEYQLVVLDSPPVVPIADSHILAGLADGVLFVVRARKTRPELFRHAMESLGASNLVGLVLNDVEYADSPYAGAYRYYQRHYLGRS